MFESRCGVECNSCEKKEQGICQGCLVIDKPCWGKCEVKACCEGRELEHCGKCPEFPCEMLSTMGVKYGFDPKPKLDRCRKWAAEEW